MLRANPRPDLRVFIIWEPVLVTDWGPASAALTALIPDRRAVHFWDRNRALSARLGSADSIGGLAYITEVGFRMKDVIWDTAILYPARVPWGARGTLLVAPVVKYRIPLDAALRQQP